MEVCTIVLEYSRTSTRVDSGSVWLFAGDGTRDLASSVPLQALAGWSRIAGPLPYQTCHEIHAALKTFFVQSGITVIDEGIAE